MDRLKTSLTVHTVPFLTSIVELLLSNSFDFKHEKILGNYQHFFSRSRISQATARWVNILDVCKKEKMLVIPKDFFHFLNQANWMLKYWFCKKSLRKNATLTSWTFFSSQKGTCIVLQVLFSSQKGTCTNES